ncbi:Ig-like domain-containing protein [Lysinibacillus xylanilyticus]|uniref:PKD domain-containing protein n=1 Tax=Lysinibacillus xylanilyticus TaxID=582475 RepID=UPI002B2530D3|nr:PKD domain-containing protein [Lysinibacillus xylanilyticus]MEB2301640.1 Ig-like domain-containing protein [Lysinibacillus xylanilyticus]
MKELSKKIAIITIAIFLLLMDIPFNVILSGGVERDVQAAAPSKPTGSSGTYKIDVKADSVPANPSVYWTQIDDLSFTAISDGGTTPAINSGNNEPVATRVKNTLDLTTYSMPTTFVGPDGNHARTELTKVYLKDDSVKFKNAQSFKGISLTKASDTKFTFVTETGSPNTPTTKTQYGKNPDGKPKYSLRYDTPIDVIWYGEIDKQAEMRVVEDSTLPVGAKKTFKAQVRTKDGNSSWSSWKDVSAYQWTSDASSVATVSSSGEVTTKATGNAKITATWKDANFHLQANATVKVIADNGLAVTGPANACFKDGLTTLKATLYKGGVASDVTNTATWSSSDTSVATVSKGVVTFKKVGSTTIKATSSNMSDVLVLTVSDCSVTPPEVEDPNPPTVTIYGPNKVKAGEEFQLYASASVEGGTIDRYEWDFHGADGGEPKDANLNGLYYLEEGEKYVTVAVEDNNNRWATDDHVIKVIPPTPRADMKVGGTLKQNRKVKIDSNSSSPKYFPITESYFTIEPLEGQSIDSIYTLSTKISKTDKALKVSNEDHLELLFKETGQYKVYHYVRNKAGLSDDTDEIITIEADQIPKADFTAVTTLFREEVKEQPEHSSAVIKITDKSSSPDDKIGKRIWTYKYDTNNNGNFNDEESILIDDTNKEQVEIPNVEKVGKYQIELEVFEDFGQPTIEEFVDLSYDKTKTDRRNHNTGSKSIVEKTIEVKNLAPVVSFDLEKKKTIDIQVALGDTAYTKAQVESKLNEILKPVLVGEQIEYNLTFVNAMLKDQPYVWEAVNLYRSESTNAQFNLDKDWGNNGYIYKYIGTFKFDDTQIRFKAKKRDGTWHDFGVLNYFPELSDDIYTGHVETFDSRGVEHIGNFVQVGLARKPRVNGITSNPNNVWELVDSMASPNGIGGSYEKPGYDWGNKGYTYRYLLDNQEFPDTYKNGFRAKKRDGTWHDFGFIKKVPDLPDSVYTGEIINYTTDGLDVSIFWNGLVRKPTNPENLGIGFSNTNEPLYSILVQDVNLTTQVQSLVETNLKSVNGHLIALGNNNNQTQFNKLISSLGKGKFINNSNLDTAIQNASEYIVSQVIEDSIKPDYSKIDLTFGIGDTVHSNQTVLESKINSLVKPRLNAEGISISSLKFESLRPTEYKASENAWEFYYGTYGMGYEYPQDIPSVNLSEHYAEGYKLPTSNHIYKILYSSKEGYEIYGKKRGSNKFEYIKDDELAPPSLAHPSATYREFTIDSSIYSEIYRSTKGTNWDNGYVSLVTRKAIAGTGDSKPVWEAVNHDEYPEVAYTHPELGYTFPTANHIYRIPASGYGWSSDYLMGERRDNGETDTLKRILPDDENIEIEIDSRIYKRIWRELNQHSRFSRIDRKVESIPINTNLGLSSSNRLQFAAVIEDKEISSQNRFDFLKQAISNNAYLSGLGKTAVNKSHFEEIIRKNMNRGTFIDNTNLDSALTQYADYIIAEIKRKSGMNELYITLEEEVTYKTNYMDAEKDPKLLERWRYEHDPNVFENNMGIASFNGKDMETPIKKFQNVGRYQPFYAAKDDPLNTLFSTDSISLFENYRLWSKDANNWYIYVHRKPIANFDFTINSTTGHYTITNKAYDLDKQSIDIGFGGGIKKMSYTWREKGQLEWNNGLPANPLQRKVYEVRQDVEDFQGATAYVIKIMDATGINKPPIADFDPIPNEIMVGESTKMLNKSYDPNGDNMTGTWCYYKLDENMQNTGNCVEFAPNAQYTNGIANNNWNPEISFKEAGKYRIKLTVSDGVGKDSTERIVTVINNNEPPVACLKLAPTHFIGDTILAENCSTDPDKDDVLVYSYIVQSPAGDIRVYEEGNPAIDKDGNLHIDVKTHPTDLGTWTFALTVSDGKETATAVAKTIVIDQTIQGQVLHTDKWLENIQHFNAKYPSKAINLDPSNGLIEFIPGEKFMLNSIDETLKNRVSKIEVMIADSTEKGNTYIERYGKTELTKDNADGNWKGQLWNEKMLSDLTDGEELTFKFVGTFKNDWVDTVEVRVKIRNEQYWKQHTRY